MLFRCSIAENQSHVKADAETSKTDSYPRKYNHVREEEKCLPFLLRTAIKEPCYCPTSTRTRNEASETAHNKERDEKDMCALCNACSRYWAVMIEAVIASLADPAMTRARRPPELACVAPFVYLSRPIRQCARPRNRGVAFIFSGNLVFHLPGNRSWVHLGKCQQGQQGQAAGDSLEDDWHIALQHRINDILPNNRSDNYGAS
mmetsp:Transcript_7210/g.16502  ORF Transcript_7210/g.16502 Transcript_7210/m.16502 type:complete len:203 (+) Transcript_7210:255-863(+)